MLPILPAVSCCTNLKLLVNSVYLYNFVEFSQHHIKLEAVFASCIQIILSFAFFWLHKGNEYELLTHPKIKRLDGGHEPPTSGLPVHRSTT